MQEEETKSCQYFNTCYSTEYKMWESHIYVYKILPGFEPYDECSSCNVYDAVLLQKTTKVGRKHCETKH